MNAILDSTSFAEGCVEASSSATLHRTFEGLAPHYRRWAQEQYAALDQVDRWPSVLNAVIDTGLGSRDFPAGLICEFGVCTGRSINAIAERFPDRPIYGFDSFEGFPADWVIGDVIVPKDMLAIDPSRLELASNVRLVRGFFDASLPPFLQSHDGSVALVHIDCDTFESARDVLSAMRSRLVPNSILVFDEILGDMGLENEMLALWSQLAIEGVEFEWLGRGGHCWTKLAQKSFGKLKTSGALDDIKLALRNAGPLARMVRSGRRIEDAQSAAAIRITRVPGLAASPLR